METVVKAERGQGRPQSEIVGRVYLLPRESFSHRFRTGGKARIMEGLC